MIIGIDASRVSTGNKTGVENYSTKLLYWFKRLDASNDPEGKYGHAKYMLYTPSAKSPEFSDLPKNFHLKEIPFPRLWTQVKLAKTLRNEKLDLFFVPSHVMPFIMPKIKTVVTIHDVAFRYFPGSYSVAQKKYLDLTTKYAVEKADHIITISKTTKEDLVKFYNCDPKKISVTYLGFDDPKELGREWKEGKWEEIQKKYKIEKPYLIYIGRLENKKNILNLIKSYYEVLSRGFDLQLVLVGKKGGGWNEAQEVITKYNLSDRIIITGYAKEWEKNILLEKAKAMVFVSKYEGFGLPVLEAFYAGIPVIASDINVFRELFSRAVVLVNPENPKEIAEVIAKLLKSPGRQETIVRRGRELLKHFTWRDCAKETLEILKNL